MKPRRITSWARESLARRVCPRRFFLRYLAPDFDGKLRRLSCLKSTRELGGHLIHEAMARLVRNIANGGHLADIPSLDNEALNAFDSVIRDSRAAGAGSFLGKLQLAESFNGCLDNDEIEYWRQAIPLCVENGRRVMATLGIAPREGREIEAEQEFRIDRGSHERRLVVDVMIADRNLLVIDWKCHSIGNEDLTQVREYQKYLCEIRRTPHSRAFGFVVDLIREEVIEAHFRPVEQRLNTRKIAGIPRERSSNILDRYPARASDEACRICPFASVCESSVWKGAHS